MRHFPFLRCPLVGGLGDQRKQHPIQNVTVPTIFLLEPDKVRSLNKSEFLHLKFRAPNVVMGLCRGVDP